MRRCFLLLLLSLPLCADNLPIDWASNWPSQCLPSISDVGPNNDNFEAIVVLPASQVATLASCAIPSQNWGSTPYELIAVAFHQAYAPEDTLSDQAWEFGDPSGIEVGYIWEEDPPPPSSVPEPNAAGLLTLAGLMIFIFLRHTRRTVTVPHD